MELKRIIVIFVILLCYANINAERFFSLHFGDSITEATQKLEREGFRFYSDNGLNENNIRQLVYFPKNMTANLDIIGPLPKTDGLVVDQIFCSFKDKRLVGIMIGINYKTLHSNKINIQEQTNLWLKASDIKNDRNVKYPDFTYEDTRNTNVGTTVIFFNRDRVEILYFVFEEETYYIALQKADEYYEE